MSTWLQVVLSVSAGAVIWALFEVLKKYWWAPREARVSAKTDKDLATLDSTVVLGWLRTSRPDSLRNVVLGLTGLEDARARQLRRVEPSLDAIIDRPYHEARGCLDSALDAGLGTGKGKKYLDKSIHDFQKAAANYSAVAPRRESWACLHLLLVYTALGDALRAQEWGARGYNAAIQWARDEVRAFDNRRELRRGRWPILRWAWTFPFLAGAIIVIAHGGHFSTGLWKDLKKILIASGVWYIAIFALPQAYGPDHYRQFLAWRAKALMKYCDQFLTEMWDIWSSLSPIPAEVQFYRVLRIDDPKPDSGLDVKTYVLRSSEPPKAPIPPPKNPALPRRTTTFLSLARKFGSQSPTAVIGWDYYEAGVQPYRLAIARSLFDRIKSTIENRGLGWIPELRSTSFAFQQPSGYDRVGVDILGSQVRAGSGQVADQPYMHSVDFWIKLPGSTHKLGHFTHHLLTHLYPLEGAWDAANNQWRWVVPTLEMLPNVTGAIELANLDQPPVPPSN
jgi:hypothetical protein